MSRIVKSVPRGIPAFAASGGDNNKPTKEYFERIAQYVPAEVIAAYTAVNGGLTTVSNNTVHCWAALINLVICAIFTPIYFKLVSTTADKPSLRTQQIISFLAFFIWVYSIGSKENRKGRIPMQ